MTIITIVHIQLVHSWGDGDKSKEQSFCIYCVFTPTPQIIVTIVIVIPNVKSTLNHTAVLTLLE